MSDTASAATTVAVDSFVASLGLDLAPAKPAARGPNLPEPKKPAGAGDLAVGSRNNQLASAAGKMRRDGHTAASIEAALLALNGESSVPLNDEEVRGIATSISKYDAGKAELIATTLNDTGNGQRYVAQHGDRVRYVADLDRWLVCVDGRWTDDAAAAKELAKVTAMRIYGEASFALDNRLQQAIYQHANRSLGEPRLLAMMASAQSIPAVRLASADMDAEPLMLGVDNGILDLKAGVLLPYSADHLITKRSRVRFDKNAKCTRFRRFMREITGNDRELVNYLQRVVGYVLTGSTKEQVCFFLYGTGANGKSTLLNVLRDLLGPTLAKKMPADTLVAVRGGRGPSYDLAHLRGARMADTSEIEEGQKLDESRFKELVGGDALAVRDLYQSFGDFVPQCKAFIAGNHRMRVHGTDHGVWRRIQHIPFLRSFKDKRDNNLQAVLRSELPGILNWALEGCLEWQRIGLSPPKIITDATDQYRKESDVLGEWLLDCCNVHAAATANAFSLYDSYSIWAKRNGINPWSSAAFGRALTERPGITKARTAAGIVYSGVAPKP